MARSSTSTARRWRRPSSSPLPQCPLRTARARQLALHRHHRCSLCGHGDGAAQSGLDRDLPRSQRTRRFNGEQRVQTEFWARYVAWSQEGFMTTLCSGMMSDVGAVCGRMGVVVDRWYHHLLVLLLVFLLSLFVRTHSSNRFGALSSAHVVCHRACMSRVATRLARGVQCSRHHDAATA